MTANNLLCVKKLIGIHGHAHVGKDTAAEFLSHQYQSVWGEAFARPLKAACSALYGIPEEWFSNPEYKNEVIEYWGKTPREMAQHFGTEVIREKLGAEHWIKRLEQKLCNYDSTDEAAFYEADEDTVIITDVRFQNEAEWIINHGGYILHVIRPGYDGKVGIPNHASEAGIVFYDHMKENVYAILNNTDLEAYYLNLRRFANWCGLEPKQVPADPPHGISVSNL